MTRPRWWSYVKNVVRDYPALHAEIEDLRSTSMTANYTGMPSGGCVSDPVASAAMRSMSSADRREHDAVESAIQWALGQKNGKNRMRIIEMVFFKRTHTLDGAAMKVGYAYGHARRLNEQFLREVAYNLGLDDRKM